MLLSGIPNVGSLPRMNGERGRECMCLETVGKENGELDDEYKELVKEAVQSRESERER